MSQADIASGSMAAPGEVPRKGQRLRDFALPRVDAGVFRLGDYRGRTNLVLILADERPETEKLLIDAAQHYAEIKNAEAEVAAIVRGRPEAASRTREALHLPFPVLFDADAHLHRELGAVDAGGNDAAAVYITDRFAEVFGIYRSAVGQAVPAIADVLNWLEFVNAQCPECEPPEWPA